ncbi:MAG: glutaredoxin 3 [Pseudomonadota bacterium]
MKQVDIYTSPICGYCHMAKRLLKQKGVEFTEINVLGDDAARAMMVERAPGSRTVPQIFIGNTHVGGSDELHALDRAGKLDGLLAA